TALRYPRDNVPASDYENVVASDLVEQAREIGLGQSRVLKSGESGTVIAYGTLAAEALKAAQVLSSEDGLDIEVVDARFCKPVDGSMLSRVLKPSRLVVTLEDHSLQNGFGTAVLEYAQEHGLPTEKIVRLGHPDRLIEVKSRAAQLAAAGIDAEGIDRTVRAALEGKSEGGAPDREAHAWT